MTSGNEQTSPNRDRDLNQTIGEMMRSRISRASTSGNPIDNNALIDLLQAVTTIVTRQQDQIDRNRTNGQNEEHPKLRSGMGEFKKLSPPSFEGRTDHMVAEHWIIEMEKVFTYMKCPEEEKVDYEFRKLEQGDKTVAEYEEEFTYLSKFAIHLLGNEEDRARRFEEGLRLNVWKTVSAFELPTYGEVLKKALLIKKNEIDTKPKNKTSGSYPKKWFWQDNHGGRNKNWRNKKQNFGRREEQFPNQKTLRCDVCHKLGHEVKNCWRNTGACLRCGQKDHKIANCPLQQSSRNTFQPGQSSGGNKHPQAKARVYSLTEKEAEANKDVVTGTLTFVSVHARVLFDSSASHSFIAAQFVKRNKLPCDTLQQELLVSTPGGSILVSTQGCRGKIYILDKELPIELMMLEMHDFDIILGMDWLSLNHASILCREKKVVFKFPGQPEFCFEGEKS
ncbi:uncharacterized protein LOC109839255 [Asparagus officinalis]|uniref:uncharacterized protein LOC109839255 n=1 Tax=Asparagus officinalis TaxID=4686 RepID=UPI00098E3B58|nr:uncharacterized protein LOC109839255 [Asparagus officinalis]